MKQIIIYCRVSTEEQGDAKNGLEAQRKSSLDFATANGYKVLEIVEEVASGKLGIDGRPVLKIAIAKALKNKAMLVVSKLDRLSRHALFVMQLMESKLNFCVAELGEEVSPFMLHIYAVVAQQEREMISKRTKDALAQLKLKGVVLGNKTNLKDAQTKGNSVILYRAGEYATKMKPSISRMIASGMSLTAIAKEFNGNGTQTQRGGQWTAKAVSNIVSRYTK